MRAVGVTAAVAPLHVGLVGCGLLSENDGCLEASPLVASLELEPRNLLISESATKVFEVGSSPAGVCGARGFCLLSRARPEFRAV